MSGSQAPPRSAACHAAHTGQSTPQSHRCEQRTSRVLVQSIVAEKQRTASAVYPIVLSGLSAGLSANSASPLLAPNTLPPHNGRYQHLLQILRI
jgi:hypothetical protein